MRMLASKKKNVALIIVTILLGMLMGAFYVYAAGNQTNLSLSMGEPKSVEERIALENQAIEIALSDARAKPLTEVDGVRIFSTIYMRFKVEFTNETIQGPGWVRDFNLAWDGKHRALVTIRYPDGTGYGIDVNITDKTVGEPHKAVWEQGMYFKYPPS